MQFDVFYVVINSDMNFGSDFQLYSGFVYCFQGVEIYYGEMNFGCNGCIYVLRIGGGEFEYGQGDVGFNQFLVFSDCGDGELVGILVFFDIV